MIRGKILWRLTNLVDIEPDEPWRENDFFNEIKILQVK